MDVSASARRAASGSVGTAGLITVTAAVTIATVWAFQRAGYTPCELCLLERNPFYAAVPLGLATGLAGWTRRWRVAAALFGLLALIFVASAGLAAYHAGVEWKIWAGPTGCSGAVQAAPSVNDFFKQLDAVKVVRCDEAALRVFGFSLAGWNVFVSLFLLVVSALGLRGAVQAAFRTPDVSGKSRDLKPR